MVVFTQVPRTRWLHCICAEEYDVLTRWLCILDGHVVLLWEPDVGA